MSELLRSINLAVKFQILAEIAANQPDIQQRDIAKKLHLSPQAISDYVRELLNDGFISSGGRSKYRVTKEGVDRMVKGLRDLQNYSQIVQRSLANISVCAAVADFDISKGQRLGLVMKDGLLYAVDDLNVEARGVAVTDAAQGEEVGVSEIDGMVALEIGKVIVIRLPSVQKGGSKKVNGRKLKEVLKQGALVGVLGIESIVALKKAGVKPDFIYGVKDAVVEAAQSGLSTVVVCVEDDTSGLLSTLEDNRIGYDIVSAA